MQMPFGPEEFLELFRTYNGAVGIAPNVLLMTGGLAFALTFSAFPWRHRFIVASLSALWLWSGIAFHWAFFTRINPAAWLFGTLFLVQAALLVVFGLRRDRMVFRPQFRAASVLGILVIVYALIGYPIYGAALGHHFPGAPSFGTPCPSTIFFFGMTLLAIETVPGPVLIIPTIWTLVGTSAALQLGMREDFILAAAAGIVLVEMVLRKLRQTRQREGGASPLLTGRGTAKLRHS